MNTGKSSKIIFHTAVCHANVSLNKCLPALNKALIDVTGEFDWLDGTEDADDIRARSRFFRQWALPYMRKGVVKSKRRFARYSQSEVHGTFWAIARAVDHALRYDLWHGRELTLHYDIQRCHAEVADEYDDY